MRKFAEIIESTTVAPPTNCLWIKGNDALYFTNGKWVSLFKKEDFINITDRFNKHSMSLIEAIQTVPTHQRIDGLVITFEDINGDWRIYQFRGDAVDFFDENKWTDLYDYTNYIVKSITPDEEDLTVSKPDKNGNAIVSLKDKVYDESNFSGKGYKILRKNIQTIDGVRKNILTQNMINKPNTIYEIRYDFDLNGAEITVPENCILQFKGGSLSNGVIKGNNTGIVNPSNSQIFKNVYFHTSDITSTYNGAGLFICKEIYAKWFGIVPNDGINNQEKFEQLSSLLCCCENINLFFEKGIYKFGKQDDVNQRNFNNCPSSLILYIGHCLLKFIGDNIKSVKIYGNGASFEDVCKHKVGWFNADGTPDYDGQGGAIYEEKKFAFSGSGIVFGNLANIENTYIENLTIDLHYQDYEYGGGIIPAILSHGIDFTNTYNYNNNNIKLYNCVSKNCLTDGFHIACYNNLNLDTAIAYNCMRTGFASGLGKRFVCKNSKFYCDYAPFIPKNPNGGKKIYIMEAPHACMNLELTLEGETLEYAYIDNCTFGDCLNKEYQLNILKQVKNCFITNCEFRRTKALINENSAWNINMNGNLYMDNLILINACYKNPITTLNRPDAHALVGRVSIFAETWDTIDEDYNGRRFELATFGSQKENCKVCEVNIYLKDKFGISPIYSPDMQYVDNIYIYIQEEIKNGDKLIGPLPHVDNLYIIDYNTEHTIPETDRPSLDNLELVKNFYYTKTSSEDNIPTIRFQDIIYKQEINWVNNKRYAPIQASRINMFDGVYNTPSQIAFSCLIESATIKDLPVGSLSFRANRDDEYCRFQKWNGEKFDEFFATPRRTSRLSFNTLDEFKTFCQTIGATKLYKGERVFIANVTYYGTGVGINLVNSNGINVESKSSGTFTERPSGGLPIGFQYFCTDKQTVEGQTSGIMIYHKGNDIWVDALGRVIS